MANKSADLDRLLIMVPGESIYTELAQNFVQAYAKSKSIKVKTATTLTILDYKTNNPKPIKLTKVTLL